MKILVALFSLMTASMLMAQSAPQESQPQSQDAKTTCSSGADVRTIEIFYETPGAKVPCRVDYSKTSGTQTLWRAQNKEGYCEEKSAALVSKLQGAGFECQ